MMFSYLIRKSQKLIPNRKFRHFEFRKCVPPNTKTTMRGIAFSKILMPLGQFKLLSAVIFSFE